MKRELEEKIKELAGMVYTSTELGQLKKISEEQKGNGFTDPSAERAIDDIILILAVVQDRINGKENKRGNRLTKVRKALGYTF